MLQYIKSTHLHIPYAADHYISISQVQCNLAFNRRFSIVYSLLNQYSIHTSIKLYLYMNNCLLNVALCSEIDSRVRCRTSLISFIRKSPNYSYIYYRQFCLLRLLTNNAKLFIPILRCILDVTYYMHCMCVSVFIN